MWTCNVVSPQLFWFRKIRTSVTLTFIISIFVNIGMWFERFVIIATSLHRDYLPSSWGYFSPRPNDIAFFAGTFGLFLTLFMLFLRYLPMMALSEIKGVTPSADPHGAHDDAHGHSEAAHG